MRARFYQGDGTDRIAAFSDGVFAIAITLLVLNLRIPDLPSDAPSEVLLRDLIADLPNLKAYVLSFLVVGLFWVTHHRVFSYIRRYDTLLIWLNLCLLLFVCVLPYPTAMLGRFGGAIPVRIYACTLAAVSLFQVAIWWYATGRGRLVDPDLSPAVVRAGTLRGLATLGVFVGSFVVSFYDAEAAMWCWLLIPVVLFVVSRVGAKEQPAAERVSG
ncbi:MAG TPA: TMEM175 family protein [Chloroflexota bacterium]|nr:TMEM175 family protein [Chloroflexota bacterium]